MLPTLAFIAFVVGAVLLICGLTVYPRALQPSFFVLALAVILLVLAYLLPFASTTEYHDARTAGTTFVS